MGVFIFLQIKVVLSKSARDKMRRKKKEEKERNHREQEEAKDLGGKEENPWERKRLNEPEETTAESEAECLSLMNITLQNAAGTECKVLR